MSKTERIILLILVGVTLLSCWSLYSSGFFYTHDSTFHIIKTHHYFLGLSDGLFPVRWAAEMANGYGYPIFNYTYPLPYFLGAVFHSFGLTLGSSLKLLLIISSVGSVLGMYYFLKAITAQTPAFFGSLLFLLVPFRFLTLFVTGQIGASLVLLWIPWLLLAIWRLYQKLSWARIFGVGVLLALILLSHLISAIVILPIILGLGLVLAVSRKKPTKFILALVISFAVAVGLASFYLIPAIAELKFVAAGQRQIVEYAGHFASLKQLFYSPWEYGYSNPGFTDGMSFQVGFGQWLVIGLTLLWLVWKFLLNKIKLKDDVAKLKRLLLVTMLAIFSLSILLMISQSNFLWLSVPFLQQVQHPWRFLLATSVVAPILLGILLDNFKLKQQLMMGGAAILLALANNRNYLRPMEVTRYPDSHYLENRTDYNGTGDISAEFLPIWTKQIPSDPPEQLIKLDESIKISNPSPRGLVKSIPKLYFPGLNITLDGQEVITFPNEQGLVSAEIPVGEHQLKLTYHQTPIEIFSNWLSLLTLAGGLGLIVLKKDII